VYGAVVHHVKKNSPAEKLKKEVRKSKRRVSPERFSPSKKRFLLSTVIFLDSPARHPVPPGHPPVTLSVGFAGEASVRTRDPII
jgi:hypothetical protein